MHILLTGGSGFIGSALIPKLIELSYAVTVLTRQNTPKALEKTRYINNLEQLADPVDAVINLAGASLAGGRWTDRYKREIRDSRISLTNGLGAYFDRQEVRPKIWLNASAIGYYGSHPNRVFQENDEGGSGFAADLCRDWESSAEQAAGDARLCKLRIGVVLDAGGGAFVEMARSFQMGVGSWMGDGRQWLSWIHRQDVITAMLFLLQQEQARGVYNLTAPHAVTNKEFCGLMRKHYRTFLAMPVPGSLLRVLVGEMADELLLQGQKVLPARLQESGFTFAYPTLTDAIREIRHAS
ncbi:MAG: TIGR01777 family oxidoreductase [Pseudomonadota bacterium]